MLRETGISMTWGCREWDDVPFVQVPHDFLRNYARVGITNTEFALVVHLASYKFAIEGSKCCPGVAALAKGMGISVRQVENLVKSLKGKGLKVVYRLGETNLYDFSGVRERCISLGGVKFLTGVNNKNKNLKIKSNNSGTKVTSGDETEVIHSEVDVAETVVVNRLIRAKIKEQEAEGLVRVHGFERMVDILDDLAGQVNVDNPGGWIIMAAREGWKNVTRIRAEADKEREKKEQAAVKVMEFLEGKKVMVKGRKFEVRDGWVVGECGVIPPVNVADLYGKGLLKEV